MKNKTKDNFMGFHIPKVEKILEEHFAVISLKHKPLISEECCVLFVQYVFFIKVRDLKIFPLMNICGGIDVKFCSIFNCMSHFNGQIPMYYSHIYFFLFDFQKI